jgi:hypothetical protein
MTLVISVIIVLIWRLCAVWMKCHRAAFRWKWWKVKWLPWGLLAFDLTACGVFFIMARTAGGMVVEVYAPAGQTLIQLVISGAAATGVRGLRMPSFLKRAPVPALTPDVERETVNQYIERAIQQSCYSASQLWIMEKVVPHIIGQHRINDFLGEVKTYLEGHDGPEATCDVIWIDKLAESTESDSRKVASACGRMLARNGFGYLEQVIARPPVPVDDLPPWGLPARHPAAEPKRIIPRPDPANQDGEL